MIFEKLKILAFVSIKNYSTIKIIIENWIDTRDIWS